jgi:hypothetical protein
MIVGIPNGNPGRCQNKSRRIARQNSSIGAWTTVLSAGSGSRRNWRLSLPHAGRPRDACRGAEAPPDGPLGTSARHDCSAAGGAVSGASGEGSGENRWRRAVRRHERRQPWLLVDDQPMATRNPSMSSGGGQAGRIDFGRAGGSPLLDCSPVPTAARPHPISRGLR